MNLADILSQEYPVSPESIAALEAVAERVFVRKKDYLVRQGVKVSHIYFVTEGLFRGTTLAGGREDTLFFGVAGDPFTSVSSFAHGEPANISFQALEDSEALAVSYTDFRRLLASCPDLLWWWSAVLLEQVYALERRYVWLGTTDVVERYTTLLKVRANIMNRIPVKYIAQYLDVTPETLSRIRAKLARSNGA